MDELEFVKKELEKHRGKGNTISAGEIAGMLGYPVEGSHVKGRNLVKCCARKYRIPVGGNASGYYRSKISRNYWLFEPKCRNNAEITYTQRLQIASYFP